jgi:hypothetical protein
MVTIKDGKEDPKGKVVQCYGLTQWKNYPNVEVSPFIVGKIARNSEKEDIYESIFD